jgi:hypothetical protein
LAFGDSRRNLFAGSPIFEKEGTLSHEVPGLVYFDRSFGSRQHV